ncbi:type IVB secretion system protein IcmH/DotU [Vibrio owensii]|uniref:type IVB secretion system protein IcmH/DotU n=1 Tax=Vibrio owensii TaxID=696485 RepID=UPI0022DD474A|nr:type IVB secretion system protein IcmH/DotU [Vibrio owensii]MDA0385206.1 type IVB secretion system protein IcmH/DotU [Vibrio owensii]
MNESMTNEQAKKDVLDFFEFRREGNNLFIDVSNALMGAALRLKTMTLCPDVPSLYEQMSEEIRNIDVELTEANVEPAIIIAFRYVLCAFLDEAVLATSWGPNSVWSAQSMLSQFHNETWGGEKVFSILDRLETEPERYKSLLVFIYQCLMLGFEGKYGVMEGGAKKREQRLKRLKAVIDKVYVNSDDIVVFHHDRVVSRQHLIKRQWPIWSVFVGFAVLWGGIFMLYYTALHHQSMDVLTQLNQILS